MRLTKEQYIDSLLDEAESVFAEIENLRWWQWRKRARLKFDHLFLVHQIQSLEQTQAQD